MGKGAPVILSNRVHSQRDPLTRALVGPAGEHWVLYRLYREGLLAALSPPGILEADILVLDIHRQVAVTIQVKTRTVGTDGGWHMQAKHEAIADPRHFYALVDLQAVPPITYIVPSAKIGQVLRDSHQSWLSRLGARGGGPQRQQVPPHPPNVRLPGPRCARRLARGLPRGLGHDH